MAVSPNEASLGVFLRDLPHSHDYRYDEASDRELRQRLFESLIGNQPDLLPLLFPEGTPSDQKTWRLRKAQGAVEGAEYTEAARGHPCGHIFKNGESTYHCKTCAADETCVLCAKCFAESDHEGHTVFISVSPGNSGCCDCADDEAWLRPVHCTIHQVEQSSAGKAAGKIAQSAGFPEELVEEVQMTVGRALDYVCDVLSCSPEQLRLSKTIDTVKRDETLSRLTSDRYGGQEYISEPMEYALVLWNDEKHTVDGVREQVARACSQTRRFGTEKALEVDEVGRSVVHYSKDLPELLRMAQVLEQIKVSVTVRSSRDTFRESMCSTVIDWLADVAGCCLGTDHHLLRNTVCTELLNRWSVGSQKYNVDVGEYGIHDHEYEDRKRERENYYRWIRPLRGAGNVVILNGGDGEETGLDGEEMDEDDVDEDGEEEIEEDDRPLNEIVAELATDAMDIEDEEGNVMIIPREDDMDIEMDDETEDAANEVLEATLAGYPPPPPPPSGPIRGADRSRQVSVADSQAGMNLTSHESDDGDIVNPQSLQPPTKLPKTPRHHKRQRRPQPPSYWLEKPREVLEAGAVPLAEDLSQRVRLDHLVLYDLRLWKTLRTDLRHLYISTVVTVVEFKRILGLRFAGLYTMLSQLYLIADREPDHSIINLSVQLLTTPSITAEVVDRANFLTNLMAIVYTFLTTRQVGYPKDVSPAATLAFDAGAITNRRMFHFFNDVRYMFQSTFVQERMRAEPQYVLQFLDLAKLHQGICPNVRAVGEHVEYETDAWISASMIIKEINRLCRLVAEAFLSASADDASASRQLATAIRATARVASINSLGLEHKRFTGSEMKTELLFHKVDLPTTQGMPLTLPNFNVLKSPMSFHHPLHYLLSWLVQAGKAMPAQHMRQLLLLTVADIDLIESTAARVDKAPSASTVSAEEWLLALFDAPLRVCVWLAQMRAGMWVRNGMTLRHQMHTYRGTSQRDVSYQRDIFMLQAGLVLCSSESETAGERFLAQMLDRYDMIMWARGSFSLPKGYDQQQQLDVVEDFFHLLVMLLTERDDLVFYMSDGVQERRSLQRELAHVLCFKPLSFSDIGSRLTDKVAESELFDDILKEMTNYRAPEGLNDSGTFELKPEFIDLISPFYAYYNRNQREDAENVLKARKSAQSGIPVSEVVTEPRLRSIDGGVFQNLAAFTSTELFARLLASTLKYGTESRQSNNKAITSRVESLLNVVLHLMLLAINEDLTTEDSLTSHGSIIDRAFDTGIIVSLQTLLSDQEVYISCRPAIRLVTQRLQQRRPQTFARLNVDLPSNASPSPGAFLQDREAKKRAALARQAKVMAQFKEQQSSFMTHQGLDWDVENLSDEDETRMKGISTDVTTSENTRTYPSEPCMLCQEETTDDRLFGCFAFVSNNRTFRQTPLDDLDFVEEVIDCPKNLDRAVDGVRPCGVASKNRQIIQKIAANGSTIHQEYQGLSKGFTPDYPIDIGPVATSCGHITHYSCFETYLVSTSRRHSQQIARNHPERLERKEFLCPLCKALGNVFLPLLWQGKTESYPGSLEFSLEAFDEWLEDELSEVVSANFKQSGRQEWIDEQMSSQNVQSRDSYLTQRLKGAIKSSILPKLKGDEPSSSSIQGTSRRLSGVSALSSLLNLSRTETGHRLGSTLPSTLPSITPYDELMNAYKRLQDSLAANHIGESEQDSPTLMWSSASALADTLAHSIAALEIANRGVVGGHTCLNSISDQGLVNLRILSETAQTFYALSSFNHRDSMLKAVEMSEQRMIFGIHSTERAGAHPYDDLLLSDIFTQLSRWSILLPEMWKHDAANLLYLSYLAQIIQVIYVYCKAANHDRLWADHRPTVSAPANADFEAIVEFVFGHMQSGQYGSFKDRLPDFLIALTNGVMRPYLQTFLRKALILMHVGGDVDFSMAGTTLDPDQPEVERLCTILKVPTPDEMISQFLADTPTGVRQRELAERWMQTLTDDTSQNVPSIQHPAIFELIGLPRTFDGLTEEAIKRPCPTTGKEINDPAICLFCGQIFCSQTSCCRTADGLGGCNTHMRKCGQSVGLFINIRKCMVLFLHNGHGTWAHAPYLDRHGEVDPTLRRHHQLFLNQKRYDKLFRDVWLNHGIPSTISRRLEGDINTGGWETL